MSDKSQKLINIALTAGAAAVGIIGVGLVVKYRKNILQKLARSHLGIFDRKYRPKPFAVEIINTPRECQDVVSRFRKHLDEDIPVLGFDVEWVTVNNDRRKIALIQLCSSLGLCALIRVCKFHKIPLELRMLLEDPEIIKAGVTPISDAKYLMQDYAIQMNGTFDLRFLAMMSSHKAQGLGSLSKSVIGIELDKDWRVRCSDWEIDELSHKQIEYASNDAFVAIEIFRELYRIVKPGAENPESIRKFCDTYTDMTFKNKMAQMGLNPTSAEGNEKKLLKKSNDLTKMLKRSYSSRKTVLYDNCHLQAPDGELLCTCDQKKARWYVEKGLGAEISQDPYTVRLNFEPAGRAVGEVGEYYRSAKENRCVVCGKEENLIRKNVVPREYRKFFPNVMKDKTSHDILLLCILCHQLSNISDLKMRHRLQEQCQAPLNGNIPKEDLDAARKLKSQQRVARALFNSEKIPEKRKEELKAMLQEQFPGQEISEEFLRNLLSMEAEQSNPFAPSHGEIVVQRFKETEGLVALEKLWRRHFLESMEPMYMPELWNVNHNGNRLEIRATEGRVEADDLKIAGVEAVIAPRVEPKIVVTSATNNNESPVKIAEKSILNEPKNDLNDSNHVLNDTTTSNHDQHDSKLDDDPETSSDWDFRSAAGSRASRFDPNRTLTEDDRYFSDATSVQSFYETIRSDGSTVDDFQSFASSLTERPDYDSDGNSRTSFCSQDLSIDSDTEVEDDPSAKMEM